MPFKSDFDRGRTRWIEHLVSEMEQGPSHGASARPVKLRRVGIHRTVLVRTHIVDDLDQLRRAFAKSIGPTYARPFLISECDRPRTIRIFQRVQVLQDGFGLLSTHSCVSQQTDAVWTGNALDSGLVIDDFLDHVEIT